MEVVFGFVEKLFYFSIVIGFVAFIHELGHFLMAKACNVRVDAFAIGMGTQKLWAKTWGETEYSIRIFPIGGFVLLAQEDGLDYDDGKPDPGERSFQRKNIFQKIAILLAGPFMNILGTIGIITLLLWYFGVNSSTLQVVKLMKDSPAQKAGFEASDILLKINGQTIERFEEGRRIIAQNSRRRIAVMVERRQGFQEFNDYSMLTNFLENSYQSRNFIRIYAKEGEAPLVFNEKERALKYLKTHDPSKIKVDVSTKIVTREIEVIPDKTGKIGIHIIPYYLSDKLIHFPFWESVKRATESTIQLTGFLFFQISDMFIKLVTKIQAPEGIGGPVAIANAVSQTVEKGLHSFLELAAQICLSIGVFNLIPIPGLDGGRIFVILLKDGINLFSRVFLGRARETFDDVLEGYINVFGVLCVLSLIILVTYKDIRDVLR